MMNYSLIILIIGSTLASIVYLCFWMYFAEPVSIRGTTETEFQFRLIKTSTSANNRQIDVISLSILCFWTLFWNALLIGVLQFSKHIEQSAVFLLQQILLLQLVSHGLQMVIVFYFFVETMATLVTFMTKPLAVTLLVQGIIFCFYFGLRLYLTYRQNGSMVILFAYKVFFFFVTLGLPIMVYFGAAQISSENLTFLGLIFLTFGSITEFIFLIDRRRHQHEREREIRLYSLCIFFLLNFSSTNFCYYWLNYDLFHLLNTAPINKPILAVTLLCPMCSSFLTTLIDPNLRKTFFEIFTFTGYCCQQRPIQNNENNEPLLGDQYQDVRNDVGEFRTEAHQDRPEDHGAHQAPELDVRSAAHSFDDDVTTGAHGPHAQILGRRRSSEEEKEDNEILE